MIPYAILTPGDNMVGRLTSSVSPSIEALADKLALDTGFADRDELIAANHGLVLGFAPIH